MSKQRFVVCVVAACLVAIVASACAARITAPACRPIIDDDEGILKGDRRGDFLHFRIGYAEGVEPQQKKAFQAAMAMWNTHRLSTGFVFEDATSAAEFTFRRGAPPSPPDAKEAQPDEKTACSGFITIASSSFIWYSPEAMDWVKSAEDVENAARIYAHELGHGLNLKHHVGGKSVMHEGDVGTACRDLAKFILVDVQESDATAAHRCGYGARLNAQNPAMRRP